MLLSRGLFVMHVGIDRESMKEIFLAVLVAGVYVGAGLLVLSGRDKQPAKDMDKDVTVLYNTRPMGSGTAHSGKAREMLQEFLVEKLE